MKYSAYVAALSLLVAAIPFASRADDSHATVMQHGAEVMPFDQKQAMHMFLPSAGGGVVEIVVHDMDPHQISLVRSHLLQEVARFAHGDYADPAYIHGQAMPGLAQLESGADRVSIRYFETPTGAAITLASDDRSLVLAIHQWLAAQQRDHASDAMNH